MTYNEVVCSAYLEVIKLKKWSKKAICTSKSLLLTYLIRDLRSFINLITVHGTQLFDGLNRHEQRVATAIINMYHQQLQMFKEGTHICADRIVSIFQSHIRPIARGKSKFPTEFGAKIGVSIVNSTPLRVCRNQRILIHKTGYTREMFHGMFLGGQVASDNQ